MRVLWIGIGGFAGTVARYGVDRWLAVRAKGAFPWGTFVVNVTGALVLGFVVALFAERHVGSPTTRLAITIGVLGGYTTFSSYVWQTMALAEDGLPWLAFVYVAGSVLAGLAAVIAGTWLGRSL